MDKAPIPLSVLHFPIFLLLRNDKSAVALGREGFDVASHHPEPIPSIGHRSHLQGCQYLPNWDCSTSLPGEIQLSPAPSGRPLGRTSAPGMENTAKSYRDIILFRGKFPLLTCRSEGSPYLVPPEADVVCPPGGVESSRQGGCTEVPQSPG